MKIHLISDLHLECCPYTNQEVEADVLVVAGDLSSDMAPARAEAFLAKSRIPVVYVPGNHEYYGQRRKDVILASLRAMCAKLPGVHLLDQDVVEISGVRFLGCTLWSDFTSLEMVSRMYGGKPVTPEFVRQAVDNGVSDFYRIRSPSGMIISPEDMMGWHRNARAWLAQELERAQQDKAPTVVVTHFCPLPGCVAPQFRGSPLNPYFANNCSDLFRFGPKAWLHGHTHASVRLTCATVPVVCNPRGYARDGVENVEFDSRLVLEI